MIKKTILILCLYLSGMSPAKTQLSQPIMVDDDIQLIHLQDSVFIHVSWHHFEGFGRFPSNGLLVIRNGKAFMIDTPPDNDKTERLVNYCKSHLKADLSGLIIGHFHDDCMGGLEFIQSKGIESVACAATIKKCKELGLPIPSKSFTDSLAIDFNGEKLVCRFFGAGHSFDNITVWIPSKKILFGGCLVKSINSRDLGNLGDAVVNNWDQTIRNLMANYPDIRIVVPGHGNHGGPELFTHTIKLVEDYKHKEIK